MNGSIENFNGWFDEKFWAKETFTSLKDMRTKSAHFVVQYNDLSTWKNKNKSLEQINPARIPKKERLNRITEGIIVVAIEVKAVYRISPSHQAQLLAYLRLSGCKVGLPINFNVNFLMDYFRRVVNDFLWNNGYRQLL